VQNPREIPHFVRNDGRGEENLGADVSLEKRSRKSGSKPEHSKKNVPKWERAKGETKAQYIVVCRNGDY
jgi:hypothetical protein